MRSCARRCGRGSVPLPGILLLIPPFLLALQLLGVGPRSPRATGAQGEQEVAFSVINIEPERSPRQRGFPSRRPGLEEEEEEEVGEEGEAEDGERRKLARTYEDENEMHARQIGSRALEVQPWAADGPSFTAELNRLITYVTRPQLNCSRVLSPGQAQAAQAPADSTHWLLCAEEWLLPAADTPCVAYSFSMDGLDADFLKTVTGLGCEVHSFDPSSSRASGGYRGNSLASNHGDGGVVSQHKMWLEWRAPRKRKPNSRSNLGSVSQTLADIMASLGHHTVHFLYADLLSAEWRVFQNWIELGTLQSVHHLVVQVHLQWAGFEVGGTNEEVLRYWFSVLRGLQASGLQLVHSSAGEGHSVLKQTVENIHSSYILSWVNTG
ncbi:probable methyltransferase-like protein 24 [Pungitius pungitius]|uniref:probable methyltransferase-like protein 24 n=1 Tax=Pungitius pungitius TaxID=134920 RepID=UPI002E155A42